MSLDDARGFLGMLELSLQCLTLLGDGGGCSVMLEVSWDVGGCAVMLEVAR